MHGCYEHPSLLTLTLLPGFPVGPGGPCTPRGPCPESQDKASVLGSCFPKEKAHPSPQLPPGLGLPSQGEEMGIEGTSVHHIHKESSAHCHPSQRYPVLGPPTPESPPLLRDKVGAHVPEAPCLRAHPSNRHSLGDPRKTEKGWVAGEEHPQLPRPEHPE